MPLNTRLYGYGNVSGRTSTVKYDPRDTTGNTIYIGGANGGVWKTTNGGVIWTPISDNLLSLSSGALAIDPNPNGQYSIIYYGTGEAVDQYAGIGLYKSTNGGLNWILIDSASGSGLPQKLQIQRIAIRPNYPNQILMATNLGLYRSTDAGLHWIRTVPSRDEASLWCNDVIFTPSGNTAFICGPKYNHWRPEFYGVHLRKSTDGGVTFFMIDSTSGFPHIHTSPFMRSHITLCRDYLRTLRLCIFGRELIPGSGIKRTRFIGV